MCSKYGDYMMKYMDGTLSEAEEARLKKHMDSCAACAEDFAAYSEILQGFDSVELVETPADFAPAVMAQISSLNLYAPKQLRQLKMLDKLIFIPFALLFATLSASIGLAFFGIPLVSWLYESGFYGTVSVVAPAVDAVHDTINAVISFVLGAGGGFDTISMILYSSVFLLVFGVLIALQFSLAPARAKLAQGSAAYEEVK